MNETITRQQAKALLPRWLEDSGFSGTVTITDGSKPVLVVMDASEYADLLQLRRKVEARAAVLRDWERKTNQPDWDEAFERFEVLSQRLADIDEETLDEALNEAVAAVRNEAQTRVKVTSH
jgi:PHD/YefM family antitoxin component YafN of YafNO toxin-antitoxin module